LERRGRIAAVPELQRRRRRAKALAKYGFNPLVRALTAVGVPTPGTALLETVGRRTGRVRRTPVTDGRDGDTFWIVAEHGRGAGYVRNLEAHPRVRVKTGRRWRTGTAAVMPDDDPQARLAAIGRGVATRVNARTVQAMATDLLVIRVDLDDESPSPRAEHR
jgi:deazaflavin-dependent oxidoreductase (nitroreductase family)